MNAKGFKDYSGTVSIKIAEDTAKDDANLGNAETTLVGEFIDIIAPIVERVSSAKDPGAKTETIEFTVIDKYLDTSNFVTKATPDEITVYVDGEEVSALVESLTYEPISKTFNKTVGGTVTNGTYVIGYTYTLVLSGFETAGVSGTVSIDIAGEAVNDTSNNKNVLTPIAGDFVDFVKPVIERVSATNSGTTQTIVFTATDKYMDISDLITDGEITVFVDEEEKQV